MLCLDTPKQAAMMIPMDATACDDASPAHLLELWENEAKQDHEELDEPLDLWSEQGMDWLSLQESSSIPPPITTLLEEFHLLEYDMKELDQVIVEQDYYSVAETCAFHNYPPSKRRKVSEDGEYIPSPKDLTLPKVTPESRKDEVSKYLQDKLDDLLIKFQSSYASVMESKKALQQQQQQAV